MRTDHIFGNGIMSNYAAYALAGSNEGNLESLRSRLVQRSVSSLDEVASTFADTGVYGNEICIVVTPEPACCFTMLTQVPSGCNTLWQVSGADQGSFLRPGGHWCWPAWYSISHMVSKQVFTFNAMPKSCPTRDSVFVDVNLSINLSIANDFERVKEFVFSLGAERLDAYLYMQVEESIRTLVYGVTHDRVNDLRSEFASEMLSVLQSKLNPLGVDVQNVKITDVALPKELQKRLESTTAFKTKITEEQKNHEHSMQQLANANEQKLAEINQKFNIQKTQFKAEYDRYEVSLQEEMSKAETERKVKLEEALGQREVAMTKAKGAIDVAIFDGRSKKDAFVSSAKIDADEFTRKASIKAKARLTEASAFEKMSKNLADARLEEAKASGQSAEETEEKKHFEQRTRLAELDARLAAKGRILVDAGSGGDKMLQSFMSVREALTTAEMKR